MEDTKLTIFKDLYGQSKHTVSKLVHTAKCKFYTVLLNKSYWLMYVER